MAFSSFWNYFDSFMAFLSLKYQQMSEMPPKLSKMAQMPRLFCHRQDFSATLRKGTEDSCQDSILSENWEQNKAITTGNGVFCSNSLNLLYLFNKMWSHLEHQYAKPLRPIKVVNKIWHLSVFLEGGEKGGEKKSWHLSHFDNFLWHSTHLW